MATIQQRRLRVAECTTIFVYAHCHQRATGVNSRVVYGPSNTHSSSSCHQICLCWTSPAGKGTRHIQQTPQTCESASRLQKRGLSCSLRCMNYSLRSLSQTDMQLILINPTQTSVGLTGFCFVYCTVFILHISVDNNQSNLPNDKRTTCG